MSNVWNTSDHHLGHKLMAIARGFSHITPEGEVVADIEAHDEHLIEQHNNLVRKQDIVWFHGDVTLKGASYMAPLVARMNGRKHLIWGNHDAGWPGHADSHRQVVKYMEVFESVQFAKVRKIGDTKVMMTHLPYVGDHPDQYDRCPEFRLPNTGMPLLCGHVHEAWKARGNQLNVGVDQWDLKPVPLETIVAWLQTLA